MATFTFEDKTSFELENGEVVVYSWSTMLGKGDITKRSYPAGFKAWLMKLVTLGFYESIYTREWLVHIALTNKRLVTVPVDYDARKKAASAKGKLGGLYSAITKTPKNMITESYYYSDIDSVDNLKEDSETNALVQARFEISLSNSSNFKHEFAIGTPKTVSQVAKVFMSALDEISREANFAVANMMTAISQSHYQGNVNDGSMKYEDAQAAFNKDAGFWNSLKEGTQKIDITSDDYVHIRIRSYISALLKECIKKAKGR